MANRLFEHNNTTPNGLVFVDPAKLAHTATLRQIVQGKNSQYGKWNHIRGIFSQNSTYSFSPNPVCTDNCATISWDGKISVEVSFPENVSLQTKEKEWDAFVANLPLIKDRLLSGRQLAMDTQLVAELIP